MIPEGHKLGEYYYLTDIYVSHFNLNYRPVNLTPYEEEVIAEMLFNHCKFTDIARALNKKAGYIRNYCKKKGLTLRPYIPT